MTNSAVSNYAINFGKPSECYAAYDKKWIKGCAFDRADTVVKNYIIKNLLGNK